MKIHKLKKSKIKRIKRTAEQISYNMSRIRAKGSRIEKRLAAALRRKGIRFSCNDKRVFGKPDIVIADKRICIFCDSEFWHGYQWSKRKNEIKSNRAFWVKKIENNMRRDRVVTKRLKKDGWVVLRFWEHAINKKLQTRINKLYLQNLI